MGFKCGIVGLPNVGKSTIFNCLSSGKAESANYPFCTIDPNVGKVAVPDKRLWILSDIVKPQKTIPTYTEFVDIAGLVKGASQGEGLGNQFLAHIREVQVIVHVVRCFENDEITHVEGTVDPERDVEIIETELMLADLETVQKRLTKNQKLVKTGDKKAALEVICLEKVEKFLNDGRWLQRQSWDDKTTEILAELQLLSNKPVLFVANVSDLNDETTHVETLKAKAEEWNAACIILDGKIEEELYELDESEREEYLKELGLQESGLNRLIQQGYKQLGLITYFTAGEKEVRAWTIKKGWKAPQAAGVIHSDFERGFICADTCAFETYDKYKSITKIQAAGILRQEGKEYIVQDGDVMLFKFNV